MRKIAIIFVAIVLTAGMAYGQNYAYVLDGLAETISTIDLESGEVTNAILNLGDVPNQVIYDNQRLYVVNSMSPSLMIIDPATNTLEYEIPMPTNSNPWNVDVDEDYAYVTGMAANSVYIVNLDNGEILNTLSTGVSPEGVLVNDDRLYVTNTAFNPIDFSYGQGSVSVFNLTNNTEISRINVGKNPQNLLIGPDGMLNVICSGDYGANVGKVYFVDTWDLLAVDSLTLGGQPTVAVSDQAGIVYVAAGGWADDGYIYSYNGNTHQVLHNDSNPIEVNTGVMGLAIDSLGNIYAACQMANKVNKITSNGTVVDTYTMAMGSGPASIAIIDSRTDIDDPVSIPAEIALGPAYPNPFNGSTNLTIDGNVDDDAEIEIYDITGRLVNRLSISGSGSINHTVTWSGMDCYGNDVASGIYFARLAGTAQTRKLVMIR